MDGVTTSRQSFYEAVGGAETFSHLVHRFYEEVKADEVLRPLYPEEDLGPAERDAWLAHMRDAVDSLELTPEQDATLWGYLEMAARSMQNRIPGGHGGLSPA